MKLFVPHSVASAQCPFAVRRRGGAGGRDGAGGLCLFYAFVELMVATLMRSWAVGFSIFCRLSSNTCFFRTPRVPMDPLHGKHCLPESLLQPFQAIHAAEQHNLGPLNPERSLRGSSDKVDAEKIRMA